MNHYPENPRCPLCMQVDCVLGMAIVPPLLYTNAYTVVVWLRLSMV